MDYGLVKRLQAAVRYEHRTYPSLHVQYFYRDVTNLEVKPHDLLAEQVQYRVPSSTRLKI